MQSAEFSFYFLTININDKNIIFGFQTADRQSQHPFFACAQNIAVQSHATFAVFEIATASVFIYHLNAVPLIEHQRTLYQTNHIFNHAQSHLCQLLSSLISFLLEQL